MFRRLFPVAATLAAVLVAALMTPISAQAATYPTPSLTRWEPNLQIAAGKTGRSWTSEWVSAKGAKVLNPSWDVSRMNNGSWLMIYVRVKDSRTTTPWKQVAQWRHGLAGGKRTTYGKQKDSLAWLDTDTLRANSGKSFSAWQVKVKLFRKDTSVKSPILSGVAGVSSTYVTKTASVSKTTMKSTTELAVPTYSQMTHAGRFPQYGGGGQAWCSPTSTSMVLRYYGLGPAAKDYAFSTGSDPWVDHAARYIYDSAYRGTGTWPFNTAYASRYGTDAVVQRFANLRSVESHIKKGVPVIVSVAFKKGELSGAPVNSTSGHLIVVRGFTADGRVIANDPAGKKNSQVRRVYNRAQFEKAWLKGSGGIAYVIAPRSMNLSF